MAAPSPPFEKLCQEEHSVFFYRHVPVHWEAQDSFLPTRTGALSSDTQHSTASCPRDFSLNTNLLQQGGFGSTPSQPAKIKAIQQNTSFFEDRNIQHHHHFPKALVFNDKVDLWVPFAGVYSDEKHMVSTAVLMEVAHIR